MLDEITAEAVALAEMQTQPEDLPTAVDSVEAETIQMAGRIAKKMTVATGVDGGPAGCPQLVDDCENTVFEGKTPGCASGEPAGQTDLSRTMICCSRRQHCVRLCKDWASRCKTCKTMVNKCRMDLRLKSSLRRRRLQEYGKDDDRQDGRRIQERTTGQTTGPY